MLPDDRDELAKLAVRMGYAGTRHTSPLRGVSQTTTRAAREQNREMLDHLLHNAFPGDGAAEPEVDLVHDPDPPPERIQRGARPLSVRRRAGRVSEPDGAGDREDSLPLDAPLPAFSGGDRPAAAGRDRRRRPTRYDAGEPQPRERFARRQGGAVGAVQLQPAVARICTSSCAPPARTWPASSPATRA